MEGSGISKINDLIIRGIENLQWLNYFAPQIILPEKTADFFLLHSHYLINFKELGVIAMPSVSGTLEILEQVESYLEVLDKRAKYAWNDIRGDFLKAIYPYLTNMVTEFSKIKGREEEIKAKVIAMLFEKTLMRELVLELLAKKSLQFVQTFQISLVGYTSKYILDKYKELAKGFGLSGPSKHIEEVTLMLYSSNIIYPVLFTTICSNRYTPHHDFLLSDIPLREEKCRACAYPVINFGIYLITEPYASFKLRHQDLSYVIASYLFNKSSGEIFCYPEVYVKKNSGEEKEEEVDVFIRNWVTGTIAIAECKVHENPQPTYDTKVNMIKQDLQQLIRKMNHVNAKFGYLITNLHFENDEEVNRVLEDAKSMLKNGLPSNVKLIGKVKGRNVITEWDSILSDLKQS
jgi:hypothetical protein